MKNVLKKLLAHEVKAEQINPLIEIFEASGNMELAAEMFLGIYQEPIIPKKVKRDDKIYEFISFNKWNNQVNCSTFVNKKKYGYFPKEINLTNIHEDNFDALKAEAGTKDTIYYSIELQESVKIVSNMTLESWLKMEEVL
jgi:hypothetical protein